MPTEETVLTPEIISALISTGGVILSAIIAALSAKSVANKEIKKQKMQWARDDTVLSKQAFSAMLAAVSRYLQSGWSRHQREALEAISAAQATVDGQLEESLCSLHAAVLSASNEDIEIYLAEVRKLWKDSIGS